MTKNKKEQHSISFLKMLVAVTLGIVAANVLGDLTRLRILGGVIYFSAIVWVPIVLVFVDDWAERKRLERVKESLEEGLKNE